MFKQFLLTVTITLSLISNANLMAQTAATGINTNPSHETWLGLSLGSISPALRSQLTPLVPDRQGVVIDDIADNSPAAKSGLRKHDVILAVEDQKIYSARQLAQMIKATPTDTEIHLTIVRQAKVEKVAVTVGEHEIPAQRYPAPRPPAYGWQPQWPQPGQRWATPGPGIQPPAMQGNNSTSSSWDSFESVQVRTLSDGRFHAEVKYKDPQGEQKSFTFEGKREEITNQIKQQDDLPPAKKQALLNALNMDPDNLFNQPFFQRRNAYGDPFADPFFQQDFSGWNIPDLQRFFQAPGSSPRSWHRNPSHIPPGNAYRTVPQAYQQNNVL